MSPFRELPILEPTRFDLALTQCIQKTHPSLARRRVKEWLNSQQGPIEIETDEGRLLRVGPAFPLSPGLYRIREEWLRPLLALAIPEQAMADPRGCFLTILLQTPELLVLQKDSGVPTLPLSAGETGTAVNSAVACFPAIAEVGKGGLEPGLIHRLDTGTSGCLAFAKTSQAFERWRSRWKSGDVNKVYRAVVSATPLRTPLSLQKGQVIDFPLTTDPSSKKRMRTYSKELAAQGASPLEARTEVLAVQVLSPGRLEVTLQITTGVRHQIRCHLATLGWPIDGDLVYKGRAAPRLMLHAWRLSLPGVEQLIEAPLPAQWPTRTS